MRFENGGLELVGEKKIIMKALNELKNDECNNYLQRLRNYGEGEVRIGQHLKLNDDIYSIGFITQLKSEIMDEYVDINTTKLDRADKIRKKANRFHVVKKKKK